MIRKNKVVDIVLIGLFVLFAVLQYNDPDGWIWSIVYGSVAALILMAARIPMAIKWFLCIGFGLGLLWYLPDIITWVNDGMPSVTGSMKAENKYIELVREAGGLLICLIVSIYITVRKTPY